MHSQAVLVEPGAKIAEHVLFNGENIIVRSGAQVDVGSLICDGVEIGQGAWVKAGSVVFNSIPPNAICQGNPALVIGYQSAQDSLFDQALVSQDLSNSRLARSDGKLRLNIGDAEIRLLKKVFDARGALTVGEMPSDIPFSPSRYFVISDVPSKELRGEHAHKICHQFLICLTGSCRVLLDDGYHRVQVTLDRSELGLYMPPMIWGTQYSYTTDSILLVFASHHYDPNDYIHSYAEFLALVKA